jgi:hypothetical protein
VETEPKAGAVACVVILIATVWDSGVDNGSHRKVLCWSFIPILCGNGRELRLERIVVVLVA